MLVIFVMIVNNKNINLKPFHFALKNAREESVKLFYDSC